MKRFMTVLLALTLALAACCALAEEAAAPAELLNGTYGDVLEKAGEDGIRMFTADRAYVAFILDGIPVRVTAETDETAKAIFASADGEEDFEKRNALYDEYWAYINTLPVSEAEVITAEPLGREELDALAGKTAKDLEGSSFDLYGGELRDEWLEEEAETAEEAEAILGARPAVLVITDGMFRYEAALDITRGEYSEIMSGEKPFDSVKVTGVTFAGLSRNAADPEYRADGTYAGGTGFGEAGGILEILTAALNGEGAEQDPEALTEALIQAMPDKEEEIRMLVPVLMELAGGEGDAE